MREEKFVKTVKKINRKEVELEYLDVAFSFDIETTSWIERNGKVITEDEFDSLDDKTKAKECAHKACLVCWTADFNDEVVLKRTWEEFDEYLQAIKDKYQLSRNRRVICFVHNLSFENEFFRKRFNWIPEECLCIKENTPAVLVTNDGIEFRCSYVYTNQALKDVELFKSDVKKQVGLWDYSLLRHTKTPLSLEEEMYAKYDVIVVNKKIEEDCEYWGNIFNFPLTSTGRVRRYFYDKLKDDEEYFKVIHKLTMSYDEYKLHRLAFAGGFTHAMWKNWDEECEDVKHIDLTSSYPAVMALMAEYPASRGVRIDVNNERDLMRVLRDTNRCWVAHVRISKLKTKFKYEAIISESHMRNKKGLFDDDVFNGRVFNCDEFETYINNIDLESMKQFYNFKIEYLEMYSYRKGRLPKQLIEVILDLFENKNILKGVEGKEQEYALLKTYLNAIYGMCATDILRDDIYFNGEYVVNKKGKYLAKEPLLPELEEPEPDQNYVFTRLRIYNNKKDRFLSYTWACFITSLARRAVFSAILAAGKDAIYCDTDSLFYYDSPKMQQYIKNYNEYINDLISEVCEDYKFNEERFSPNGYTLGQWDFEKDAKWFKTLGAKRYMEIDNEGKTKITVAGVSKEKGSEYMDKIEGNDEWGVPNKIKSFNNDLKFPKEYSGRKISCRIKDEIEGDLVDYTGIKAHYHELSALSLYSSKYEMSDFSALKRFISLMVVV